MSVPWSSWPPSQGDVQSVFGRTGVVVAAAGDYLASQISNDSRIPGTTVAAALNNLSSYLAKPAVADAFDDEFFDGSADLATRGWTIVNPATGLSLTRIGDINPWVSGSVIGGQYRSTIVGSSILIQGAPGTQVDVYKNITLAAGDTYFARVVGTYNLATGVGGRGSEVGLYGASGANLDNNNRVFSAIFNQNSAAAPLQIDGQRVTGGAAGGGTTGRTVLGASDIRGIYFQSGTTHFNFYLGSTDSAIHTNVITGTPAAATLTRFGIRNQFDTSGSDVPQIFQIDFARKKTSNAWLIP